MKNILTKFFGFVINKVLPVYGVVFIAGFWVVGLHVYYFPEVDRKQMCQ